MLLSFLSYTIPKKGFMYIRISASSGKRLLCSGSVDRCVDKGRFRPNWPSTPASTRASSKFGLGEPDAPGEELGFSTGEMSVASLEDKRF